MIEDGVLAYPVILAAMVTVCRIGRHARWGALEWLRLGALALLLGLLVAVHVQLVLLGAVRSPWTLASAIVSMGGMGVLLALYLWDVWARRASAPRADVRSEPEDGAWSPP